MIERGDDRRKHNRCEQGKPERRNFVDRREDDDDVMAEQERNYNSMIGESLKR